VAVAREKGSGENEIVRVGRVDFGGFASVVISFHGIAFGIPIDGEIAVSKGERILRARNLP